MFADVVTEIIERQGLSRQGFADGINSVYRDPKDRVVKMTISYWARGRFTPPFSAIDFLARYAPDGSWMREFGERGGGALLEAASSVADGN